MSSGKMICHEYVEGDLRDPRLVESIMAAPQQISDDDTGNSFDEVYQLAADIGVLDTFSLEIMMPM